MLKFQNDIYSHKYFQRALRGALRVFLHLIDCPEDIDGLGHLPPLERKKRREKVKKANKKKAEEEAKKAAEEAGLKASDRSGDSNKKEESPPQPDEDYYLAKDFLAEGLEWCNTIVNNNVLKYCSCETISLVSDLYARRGEYISAIDALTVGMTISKFDPYLVYSLVRIALKVKTPGKKSIGNNETIAKIKESLGVLMGSDVNDIEGYVYNYRSVVSDQGGSFLHLLSLLKCQYLLDKEKCLLIVNEIVFNNGAAINLFESGRDRSVYNVVEVYKFLSQYYPDHDVTKAYQLKVESYYPEVGIVGEKKTMSLLRAEDNAVKALVSNSFSNDHEVDKSTA